jgi:hypothetical protein
MRRRHTKTLEKAARSIRDADEFVTHVFNIAWAYRSDHLADQGPGNRDVKRALRSLRKHATALSSWIESANRTGKDRPERDALDRIGVAKYGSAATGRQQSIAPRLWLEDMVAGSAAAEESLRGKHSERAPKNAAEALRATFEHHGLKLSQRAEGEKLTDAVRLLCAIAKDAGDESMAPAAAREWLRGARAPVATKSGHLKQPSLEPQPARPSLVGRSRGPTTR